MKKRIRFSLFTFILTCTLLTFVVGMSLRTPPPAELAIQIIGNDYRGEDAKTGIRIHSAESHFHVVITNQSDRNVRLWEAWNSWGHYNLTFELLDANGKSVGEIQKPPRFWTMNYPSYLELKPDQHHVLNVYFNPNDWEIPNQPMGKREGPTDYRLIARYKIEECADSKKHSVWTGELETEPIDIKLGYWPE